jgi:uncharacterized coiled-coil protein SlyX
LLNSTPLSKLSPFSVADLLDTNRRDEAIKRVCDILCQPSAEELFSLLGCESPLTPLVGSAQQPGEPSKYLVVGDPATGVPQSFPLNAGTPRAQKRKRHVAAERTVTSLLRTIMTHMTGMEARLDTRITDMGARITDMGARLDTRITDMGARLDTRITDMEARLDFRITDMEARLDTRITGLDTRIAELSTRIAGMDDKLDVLSEKFDQHLHRRSTVLPLLAVLPVTSFVRAHPFAVLGDDGPSRVHAFDCEWDAVPSERD